MNDEILIRTAVTLDEVRFAKREIDVFAVPYGVPTRVFDRGRAYVETIAKGAFGNVAGRANRVKVFRDHRPERAVGRCKSIHANGDDGLRATLHISDIPLGDETLKLAADDVLQVSIGFSPTEDGDSWSADGSTVTRTKVWLHELSLVPLPAYDSTTIEAVRDGGDAAAVRAELWEPEPAPPSTTPLLDTVLARLAEIGYPVRK